MKVFTDALWRHEHSVGPAESVQTETRVAASRAPGVILLFLWSLASGPIWAGSIVEVQTSLGNFYIEVNEEAAPVTAGNFLNYVTSGRYNNTFIHSVSGGARIEGGGYRFNACNDGPQAIDLDAPIPLERTGLSNTGGSIAAWHPSTQPDGATSQWLINLGGDPALDSLNGGYAVFGRVLGDGLSVVSAIAQGNPVRLGFFEETPTINYLETSVNCQQFSRDNLVLLYMAVIDANGSAATADYDQATGQLLVNIDLGADGFQQIAFSVDASSTPPAITPQLASAISLPAPVPNMANYDQVSRRLTLPSIAVDGQLVYRNVVFELVDADSSEFRLRSAD